MKKKKKKEKKNRNDKVGHNLQDCDLVSSSARFRSSVNFGSLVSSLQSALAEYCEFQTSTLSWQTTNQWRLLTAIVLCKFERYMSLLTKLNTGKCTRNILDRGSLITVN